MLKQLKERLRSLVHHIKSPRMETLVQIQLEIRPYLQGIPYWMAAAVVGLAAVAYSGGYTWCIEWSRTFLAEHPNYFLVTCPLFFVLATWVVERYAPEAGGTGIPQVNYALSLDPKLNQATIHSYLRMRVVVVIVLSTYLSMLGGGSLGREGPMVQIGACLFYAVGTQFQKIWPYDEHRSWIVAGGAAGVAAAFNAPLAGVVFVLEELAGQHFHRFKTTIISAAIIAGIVSQWLSGRYLFLGFPKMGDVPLSSVPWSILVGVVCGIAAVPFHRMLTPKFRHWFSRFFNTRIKFSLFAGLCMALLARYVDPGVIGGGVSSMVDLLFDKSGPATWGLIVARYLGTIISYLAGVAGGFLAPSLALGAAIGSKIAALTNYPNPTLMTMVGMSAFLSAIIRAPFTAWVIVMEMTDRHSAIFPLMVASLVSYGVAHALLEFRRPPPPAGISAPVT